MNVAKLLLSVVLFLLILHPITAQTYFESSYNEDVTEANFQVVMGSGNFSIVFDSAGRIGTVNTDTVEISIYISKNNQTINQTYILPGETLQEFPFELTGERQITNFQLSSTGSVSFFVTTEAQANEFLNADPFSIVPYLILGAIPLLLVIGVFLLVFRKIK